MDAVGISLAVGIFHYKHKSHTSIAYASPFLCHPSSVNKRCFQVSIVYFLRCDLIRMIPHTHIL